MFFYWVSYCKIRIRWSAQPVVLYLAGQKGSLTNFNLFPPPYFQSNLWIRFSFFVWLTNRRVLRKTYVTCFLILTFSVWRGSMEMHLWLILLLPLLNMLVQSHLLQLKSAFAHSQLSLSSFAVGQRWIQPLRWPTPFCVLKIVIPRIRGVRTRLRGSLPLVTWVI